MDGSRDSKFAAPVLTRVRVGSDNDAQVHTPLGVDPRRAAGGRRHNQCSVSIWKGNARQAGCVLHPKTVSLWEGCCCFGQGCAEASDDAGLLHWCWRARHGHPGARGLSGAADGSAASSSSSSSSVDLTTEFVPPFECIVYTAPHSISALDSCYYL